VNKVIRGVVAVAGCVMLAGASVADEESNGRGQVKDDVTYVPPHARGAQPSQKIDSRSARRKVYPEPIKERTRDVLRAKRPK
jgi:hypothetical protein